MDILKASLEWTKAEVFSTLFFILFGVIFIVATIGFWQLGKTEMAKAFIYPTLVAGVLLLVLGLGLFFSNKSRLANFEADYNRAPSVFVESEIERADKTIGEYTQLLCSESFQLLSFLLRC